MRVMFIILTRLAYLPTTITSDKRSAFLCQAIRVGVEVPKTVFQYATTKLGQTIGMLERRQKITKDWNMCTKVIVAQVCQYCDPKKQRVLPYKHWVFHGRLPYKMLGLKMEIRPRKIFLSTSQIIQGVLANKINLPRWSQKCHASLFQVQNVFWQKKWMLLNWENESLCKSCS